MTVRAAQSPDWEATLRERAQGQLEGRAPLDLTVAETRELIHELQVHQMELQLQNEELRQARVQLADSRDRYVELFEFAPVGYVTLNDDGVIKSANLTAARLLGIERGLLVQTKLSRFIAPLDQDAAYLHRQDVFASQHRRDCELQMLTADKTPLFIRLESVAVGDGDARQIHTALVDVTRRQAAEEQLHSLNQTLEQRVADQTSALLQSQNRIWSIVNTAADAIITFQEDGTIIQANAATEQLFGFGQRELEDQQIQTMLEPPHQLESGDIAPFLPVSGSYTGQSAVARRKDGSTFPIELSISEVKHYDFFTAIIRDVSERAELQRQILEIAAEEQRRIGRELHDSTGQELTALTLFARSLLDSLDKLEREHPTLDEGSVEGIRGAAEKLNTQLSESVRDIQNLARGIMPVVVDGHALVAALDTLATFTSEVEHITCRFECETAQSITVEDNTTATHLYRIAQEAVNNAMKHSEADEIVISLCRADGRLLLEVEDNGTGISVDAVKRRRAPQPLASVGLPLMQYRADLIGAVLEIGPLSSGGTLVRCTL